MKRSAIVALIILLVGSSPMSFGESRQQRALETQLEARKQHPLSSIVVTLNVINKGQKPIDVCVYQTPFEHKITTSTMFKVIDAHGKEVDYRGIQAKRPPPGKEDIVPLEPGKSLTAAIDLAESYEWRPGKFLITFTGNERLNHLPSSNTIGIEVMP